MNQQKAIAELLAETHAHDGLAPVDLARFWADQDASMKDPFGNIPQLPLGAVLTAECVYDELGIPEDHWRYETDPAWRLSIHKAYNDRAEKVVGRRILSEAPFRKDLEYPPLKRLNDVFESENVWQDQSWWLKESAHTPEELKALLDHVDGRDIRKFILPENWAEEKARLTALGVTPPLYRSQRGPVTFATSVYGAENFIFLLLDEPDLAARFRDAILRVMLEIGRIQDEEAGYTPATAPRGFMFYDDNCSLLNRDMYEFFGYPVLEKVFSVYSTSPGDLRYQHSDSKMAQLLPCFGKLGLNRTNFGPTLSVREIRENIPHAIIDGQMAPFTYSRNEEENILKEFFRDFEQGREKRGLVLQTAGSINNGTRLTSMRLLMAAIQKYGRYA